ncbi:unnamed protein product, partial [Mesorhabditis belari]|uniref:Uncharacterized protein n=1 Tax=Mesorhabditis belari TaxID=2138241 RepID=A0AAF3EW85_9BILA
MEHLPIQGTVLSSSKLNLRYRESAKPLPHDRLYVDCQKVRPLQLQPSSNPRSFDPERSNRSDSRKEKTWNSPPIPPPQLRNGQKARIVGGQVYNFDDFYTTTPAKSFSNTLRSDGQSSLSS